MQTNEQYCQKYGIEPDNFWDFIYREQDIHEDEIVYEDTVTGEYVFDYPMIFMLYFKHYNKETIEANFQFTSLPIYPNMKHFSTECTYLSNFNIQPNMESCSISYASDLRIFQVQPKLKMLYLEMNNELEIVETQPEMTTCTLCDLMLKEFCYQPKLEHLTINGCDIEKPVIINKNTKIHGDTGDIKFIIKE